MTFSLAAYDADSQQIGAIVCSNLHAIGARALFSRAGVGIVLTQMICEPSLAESALDSLAQGMSASAARDAVLAGDPGREQRQLMILSNSGEIAVFTGSQCVAAAGHAETSSACAIGAMARSAEVWEHSLGVFESSAGMLAERLLKGLEAGAAAGGDLRGNKAARLIVVSACTNSPWLCSHPVDIRVDDHESPLGEVRRLFGIQQVIVGADLAFDRGLGGDMPGAFAEFREIERLNPDDVDVALRYGILLAFAGDADGAALRLKKVSCVHEGWREVINRLPAAGFLPKDEALLRELGIPIG